MNKEMLSLQIFTLVTHIEALSYFSGFDRQKILSGNCSKEEIKILNEKINSKFELIKNARIELKNLLEELIK